jgi:hypothetical protein
VCITCDLVEQYGGQRSEQVRVILACVPQGGPVIVGYVRKWRDERRNTWWVASSGVFGDDTVPLTRRAQSYRQVSGRVVPLFGSHVDGEHAVKVAIGQAVDA